MSSGIICTISLDPFYQQFLRVQEDQEDYPVFSFPKNHDLGKTFQAGLNCRDITPKKMKSGWEFKIEIPYRKSKNPEYYNKMSEDAQREFQSEVRLFARRIIDKMMHEQYLEGIPKEMTIIDIMEDYNFSEDHRDRIVRWYNRLIYREKQKRYRNKKKVLKSVKI